MDIPLSRKRPRPVVSCLRCRDKKLKCDRVQPTCGNCFKGRLECAFVDSQHIVSKRVQVEAGLPAHSETNPNIGIIEDLQQRMVRLESMLAVKPHTSNSVPVQESWPRTDTSQSSATYLGTLVLKGNRSRYHGQQDRITLLNQFPEAKTFINQSLTDSSLVGLAKEVQFLKNKSQTLAETPESFTGPGMETFPELQELKSNLPSKSVCDRLVAIYQRNFEKVHRILHVPSFVRDYNNFWAQSGQDISFLSMFLPIVTSVLLVSVVFDGQSPSSPYSSTDWDYLYHNAIAAVQAWMQKLPRKQKTEIATLQVGALILLARQLHLRPPEEIWSESGSLVRSAMVMGLHVNISQWKGSTPLHAELRRRLWITIVEMDLQASMTAGMPVITPDIPISSLIPSNLNDADFDDSSNALPPPRSLDEETDSIYQIILSRSLEQRIRAVRYTHNTNPQDDIGERLRQGERMQEVLDQIPASLKPDHDSEDVELRSSLNRVLLSVFIRRPLVCLLKPMTSGNKVQGNHPLLPEVQRMCLESSMAILSYQDLFDPNLLDLDIADSSGYWNVFQKFCQSDIFWAALGVCEYLKFLNIQSSIQSPSNEFTSEKSHRTSNHTGSQPPLHNKATLIRQIEITLDSLTRRIGEKGANMKDVLLLSVVLQLVRARGPLSQKESRMSEGAKDALAKCRQNLLSTANEAILPYFDNSIPQISTEIHERVGTASDLPDFLQQSAALAAEFDTFQSDLLAFDDASFMWNM
ncbi:hypothetical protein N7478_004257 [Penicillium angulare]|uniref:uncharacterized protein n=1 Tax=Penicillium angulare TaxID=116970 RepID=UPI002541A505|nr:uncharacterized protein N7478_004257 [Penicillium angulare]KAJ5278885.1 hypothetical protein N7478_004257 [Penicillium angulare]